MSDQTHHLPNSPDSKSNPDEVNTQAKPVSNHSAIHSSTGSTRAMDNSEYTSEPLAETAYADDSQNNQYNEQQDGYVNQAKSLLGQLKLTLEEYKAYGLAVAKLAEAEGRYALANLATVFGAALVMVVLTVTIWALFCGLLVIGLATAGLGPFLAVLLMMIINIALAAAVAYFAKNRLEKVSLRETRQLLAKPTT